MSAPQRIPVAIYARISSDREGKAEGVTRQLDDCRKLADLQRLDVVQEIVENDTSAYRRKRKGYEQLKALAMKGIVQGVVAYDSDRLYRSMRDLESMITVVEEAPNGFTIYSVTTGDINLNSPSGRAMARVLAGLAQYEVEQKAQRQARAQKEAFRQGRWSGGKVPLGYRLGDVPGELLVDAPIAAVLRETANKILVEGYSLNAATRFFREKTGRPAVKPITLRGVLTGPNIAGMREYLPVADKRRGITKGTVRKANWEPILDMKTWKALKEALKTTPRGRPARTSLLSGLLECGVCGTTLGYSTHSYKCTTTTGGCGKVGISTKGIEAHMLKLFDIDDRDPNATLLLALLGVNDPRQVPVTDISAELAELADERAQLLYFLKKKTVKAHEIDSQLDEIAAREEELETLQGNQLVANAQNAAVASLRAEWGKLTDSPEDTAKKNLVFRGMFKRVVVRPATKQGPTLDPFRLSLEGHDPIEPLNPDEIVWWSDN